MHKIMVLTINNLGLYNDNDSKTCGNLYHLCRHEPSLNNAPITESRSFKFKLRL